MIVSLRFTCTPYLATKISLSTGTFIYIFSVITRVAHNAMFYQLYMVQHVNE